MSSSTEVPKRRLVIDTGLPTAEIFVIDGAGHAVARGVGQLAEALAPGIYKMRIRLGHHVQDQIFELPPGEGDHYVHPPEALLATAVPFEKAGEASPAAEEAGRRSRTVEVRSGEGSEFSSS